MKTFTLEEIKKLLGESMNIDAPLAQKIMSKFNGDTPDKEAEKILENVNKLRFMVSGSFRNLDTNVSKSLENLLSKQIIKSYYNEYPSNNNKMEQYIFEKGYRIGIGAVDIKNV